MNEEYEKDWFTSGEISWEEYWDDWDEEEQER